MIKEPPTTDPVTKDELQALYKKAEVQRALCSSPECTSMVKRLWAVVEKAAQEGKRTDVYFIPKFEDDIETVEDAAAFLKTNKGIECWVEYSHDKYCDPHEMFEPSVRIPSHNWTGVPPTPVNRGPSSFLSWFFK